MHVLTVPVVSLSLSDIDECALDLAGCGQTCTNTEGSFVCSCEDGYQLDGDGKTCSGEKREGLWGRPERESIDWSGVCSTCTGPPLPLSLSVPLWCSDISCNDEYKHWFEHKLCNVTVL